MMEKQSATDINSTEPPANFTNEELYTPEDVYPADAASQEIPSVQPELDEIIEDIDGSEKHEHHKV